MKLEEPEKKRRTTGGKEDDEEEEEEEEEAEEKTRREELMRGTGEKQRAKFGEQVKDEERIWMVPWESFIASR